MAMCTVGGSGWHCVSRSCLSRIVRPGTPVINTQLSLPAWACQNLWTRQQPLYGFRCQAPWPCQDTGSGQVSAPCCGDNSIRWPLLKHKVNLMTILPPSPLQHNREWCWSRIFSKKKACIQRQEMAPIEFCATTKAYNLNCHLVKVVGFSYKNC